jgi:hypothetical protein
MRALSIALRPAHIRTRLSQPHKTLLVFTRRHTLQTPLQYTSYLLRNEILVCHKRKISIRSKPTLVIIDLMLGCLSLLRWQALVLGAGHTIQ